MKQIILHLGIIGLVLLCLTGCPATHTTQTPMVPAGPEEKVYRLSVDNELQVSIEDNEAMVYRFDADITQSGLYEFATQGKVDTLCALVHGSKNKERFVVVRDVGGTGENCRLVWAFPAGTHRFKVRVDGQGSYRVRLKRIPWGRKVKLELKENKPYKNTVEKIIDRHQFQFELRAPRMIQLRAKGKGLLQCMLRKAGGEWLTSPDFRQPYGDCTLGQWLPKGTYLFDLRSNRPNTSYALSFQQIRMQTLASNEMGEGYLQGSAFDIFQVDLKPERRHIIQTYGIHRLHCTLEDRLGHVVVPHRATSDGRNCLLQGQFAAGKYFLRVHLVGLKSQGAYQVSLRQHKYEVLPLQVNKEILPSFQSPYQLYRLTIPTSRLYQIDISGRPLLCTLRSSSSQRLPVMNLSEPTRCLLFANFHAGTYFLRVVPTTRDEIPYRLKLVQYQPQQGDELENEQPRLIGPVHRGYKKTFTLKSTEPQLVTLETRGNLDTLCTLFDAAGGKLGSDDDSGKRLNCQITRYLKPGTYQLKVKVGGSRSGLFWVQRRRKKLPWLRLGQTVKAELKGKKKPHTYMLRIAKTGLYGFRTEGKLDTQCKILDNDWQQIAKDDDSGTGKNCFLAQLLMPGIYAIQVELYRSQSGPYQLVVDQLNLGNLQDGKSHKSNFQAPHWTNFYRIHVKQPGLYALRTNGKLDTQCRLLTEQSKELAKNDDTNGTDKNCEILENLQPGIYFFQVWLYKDSRKAGLGPYTYQALFATKNAPVVKLKMGQYANATMAPNGVTRFMIEIKRTGRFRMETKSLLDPKCLLLDPGRKQISSDDDSGLGRNCRIEWRLQKGTYELQVRPATNTRNSGPYRIGVFRIGD